MGPTLQHHPALAEMLPLFQPAQVRHSMHTWRSFIKRPRYEDVTCGPGYSRGQLAANLTN